MRASNAPTPRAGQLDRCDICGDKYHKEELVRTAVEFLQGESENYFLYSSWNGVYWVVDDAADEDKISFGVFKDSARTSVSVSNVVTVVDGVQTWDNDAVVGTTAPLRSTTAASTGSEGYVTFSIYLGAYDLNTDQGITAVMGICNSDGSIKQPIKTWTFSGERRIWFTESSAALAAYGLGETGAEYFYVQVTNTQKWWADLFQLEHSDSATNKPGMFVKTNGSTVDYATDKALVTNRKVCPKHFELVWKKSEQIHRTDDKNVADPIRPYTQEF